MGDQSLRHDRNVDDQWNSHDKAQQGNQPPCSRATGESQWSDEQSGPQEAKAPRQG